MSPRECIVGGGGACPHNVQNVLIFNFLNFFYESIKLCPLKKSKGVSRGHLM